jgi:hypothetical protein
MSAPLDASSLWLLGSGGRSRSSVRTRDSSVPDMACSYAHYEMKLIDLPGGTKAWVCDPVEWAIYPERREQLRDLLRNSAEGRLLSHIFGHGDPDSEQR